MAAFYFSKEAESPIWPRFASCISYSRSRIFFEAAFILAFALQSSNILRRYLEFHFLMWLIVRLIIRVLWLSCSAKVFQILKACAARLKYPRLNELEIINELVLVNYLYSFWFFADLSASLLVLFPSSLFFTNISSVRVFYFSRSVSTFMMLPPCYHFAKARFFIQWSILFRRIEL